MAQPLCPVCGKPMVFWKLPCGTFCHHCGWKPVDKQN